MEIRSVEYAGTVASPSQPAPGDLPEVAFSGRSNVGKSSLINVLLRRTRHKIAHVSATPGKTRALNYYRVNGHFFLVDLPGFGYARVPARIREEWETLIEGYLERSTRLRGVVHLVDARHGPAELDRRVVEYLAGLGVPALVVATKIDKLSQSERRTRLESIRQELGVDPEQLVPFSAHSGEGREVLLAALAALLGEPSSLPERER